MVRARRVRYVRAAVTGHVAIDAALAFGESLAVIELFDPAFELIGSRSLAFDRLLAEHRAAWAQRWEAVDVQIGGDPEAELALIDPKKSLESLRKTLGLEAPRLLPAPAADAAQEILRRVKILGPNDLLLVLDEVQSGVGRSGSPGCTSSSPVERIATRGRRATATCAMPQAASMPISREPITVPARSSASPRAMSEPA